MSHRNRKNIRANPKENLGFLDCNHQQSYNLFPKMRLRRLRKNPAIRDLFQEIRLSPKDLVLPLFVQEGIEDNLPIDTMPGIFSPAQIQTDQKNSVIV